MPTLQAFEPYTPPVDPEVQNDDEIIKESSERDVWVARLLLVIKLVVVLLSFALTFYLAIMK